MTRLCLVSISGAVEFVALVHRHLPRVVGGVFAVGLLDEEAELAGVAILGRPVAREADDGWTLEVTRCAVRPGVRNGCSMLYGAARGVARASGAALLQTYTLASEPGSSLRAAGFVKVASVRAQVWPKGGGVEEPKHRWEIRFSSSPPRRDEPTRAASHELRGRGASVREVARELGISKSRAGRILRGVPSGVPAAGGTVDSK